MRSLQAIRSAVSASDAALVFVYVAEAHAADRWSFSDNAYHIRTHQCLDERLQAARELQAQVPGVRVVCDGMEDEAAAAFAAVPERLAVVRDGRVRYLGGPGPFFFAPDELRAWLAEHC